MFGSRRSLLASDHLLWKKSEFGDRPTKVKRNLFATFESIVNTHKIFFPEISKGQGFLNINSMILHPK